MHSLKVVQATLLALPLVALGCGPQRADTRETPKEMASALPGPAAAVTVELGSKIGDDGRVAGHTDRFRKGEPIIAAINASTLKTGTGVRLTWTGPQGQVLANDEISVPPDARTITFKAQDTGTWEPGTYRVDINDAGVLTGSKTFTIE
jgi:hypothetical protein